MAKIRGGMFDFGNVVGIYDTIRWYSFIREKRGNCFEPHESFSGSRKDIIDKFDLNQTSEKDFFNFYVETYQLKNISMSMFFNMFSDVMWVDWEMLSIVRMLRRAGIMTILVTNMNSCHLRHIRRHYPEVMASFDYRMISCEEGVIKPNPEALIRPLEWAGLKAEETIFVDDNYVNVEMACGLGVKGWYYNVTDECFRQNGKLNEERQKLKNYLELLWKLGIIKPHEKSGP